LLEGILEEKNSEAGSKGEGEMEKVKGGPPTKRKKPPSLGSELIRSTGFFGHGDDKKKKSKRAGMKRGSPQGTDWASGEACGHLEGGTSIGIQTNWLENPEGGKIETRGRSKKKKRKKTSTAGSGTQKKKKKV